MMETEYPEMYQLQTRLSYGEPRGGNALRHRPSGPHTMARQSSDSSSQMVGQPFRRGRQLSTEKSVDSRHRPLHPRC